MTIWIDEVNKEVFVKHSNKKEYKYFVIKVKFYLRFDNQRLTGSRKHRTAVTFVRKTYNTD